MKFTREEVNTLLSAAQHYRRYTEKQVITREDQGWSTEEQAQRIQILDDIEEKLFDILGD